MQRGFLLLMAVCALAAALPRDKRSAETEDSEEWINLSDTTTVNNAPETTTVKPNSKVITIKTVKEMSKKISEAGDKLVILFIMSTKCGLSQWIAPIVEDIANTMDNVVVLKVPLNVDGVEIAKIERQYHEYFDFEGRSRFRLPVFGFLKNGSKLEHYDDGSDIKKLRDTIAKYTSEH